MRKTKSILMLVLWLTSGNLFAQVGQQRVDAKETTSLDAEREKHALQVLAKLDRESDRVCRGCHARRQVWLCANGW